MGLPLHLGESRIKRALESLGRAPRAEIRARTDDSQFIAARRGSSTGRSEVESLRPQRENALGPREESRGYLVGIPVTIAASIAIVATIGISVVL